MAEYELREQKVGVGTTNPHTVQKIKVSRHNGTKVELLASDIESGSRGYKILDNQGNVIAFLVSSKGEHYIKLPNREQMVVNFRIGIPDNFAVEILSIFNKL